MTNLNAWQSALEQPLTQQWLNQICKDDTLDGVLEQMVAWLGQQFECDRVFLYVRSPYSQLGRVPFCWVRNPQVETIYDADWKPEPSALPAQDPMFAAALKAQPSLFIEDVETASSKVLNRSFEAQHFGHRALIHAHISIEGMLWGILQPCVFSMPRKWNQRNRQLTEKAIAWLTPLVMEYVSHHAPAPNHYSDDC